MTGALPKNCTSQKVRFLAFREAVRRAGIEDFHFHDLRRTCASRLHKAGVPLVRISRDLGHTNLKTTMIYIGLTDEEET